MPNEIYYNISEANFSTVAFLIVVAIRGNFQSKKDSFKQLRLSKLNWQKLKQPEIKSVFCYLIYIVLKCYIPRVVYLLAYMTLDAT